MKKTILTTAIVIAAIGAAQAQQQTTYYKGQSKQDVIFGLLSSQYDSDNPKTPDPKTSRKKTKETKPKAARSQARPVVQKKVMQSAVVNDPTNYVLGEDKYLKTKEENKRYSEFEVFDIKGMNKDQVVLGMLTNTLDRGTRFDEKGDLDKKIFVSTGYVEQIDEKGKIIPGKKVPVSTLRINDKVFVIIGDNDYRYQDGKRLVGGQKMIDEMIKGKPVTELTFYYELQKAGVLDKNISLKQFTKLGLNEKQELLNNGSVVATAD